MNKYAVISPSYKRAKSVMSHKHFRPDLFKYAVHAFESQSYRDQGHNVLEIPDSLRGNIARVRNFILENSDSRNCVMVDDDISSFFWIITRPDRRERVSLDIPSLDAMIERGYLLAEDCGTSLWGMNCSNDPRFYTQNRPFGFSLPVLGTFSAHRLDETGSLRYDETLPVKEDYDFFLKTMIEKRLVLRLNFLMYNADHQNMDGGCQDYRTEELEQDNFDRLQQRYGSKIVQRGSSTSGLDINPVIKRPI